MISRCLHLQKDCSVISVMYLMNMILKIVLNKQWRILLNLAIMDNEERKDHTVTIVKVTEHSQLCVWNL